MGHHHLAFFIVVLCACLTAGGCGRSGSSGSADLDALQYQDPWDILRRAGIAGQDPADVFGPSGAGSATAGSSSVGTSGREAGRNIAPNQLVDENGKPYDAGAETPSDPPANNTASNDTGGSAPARPVGAKLVYDFGGMYGYHQAAAGGTGARGAVATSARRAFNNPITGGPKCPPGYDKVLTYGTKGMDNSLYYCARERREGETPEYDFGGMYGQYFDFKAKVSRYYVNPATGKASCPDGYQDEQVLGTKKVDYPVHYCWRRHADDHKDTTLFAGMYGFAANPGGKRMKKYVNPMTRGTSCPSGAVPSIALGTRHVDFPLIYCVHQTELESGSSP